MEYDGYGNITAKNEDVYTYDNAKWKDLLTKVGNQTISYDNQGNPISYLGHTLTWEKGRQLKSFDTNTYTYNANGIRTSKTINGVKHTYVLDGTKILKETWGNNVLIPLYDNEDSVCGIEYNGTAYWFYKNLQGDIISIANADGDVIANYNYDAWGRLCSIIDTDGNAITDNTNIAVINPFRYRGYYYDTEIGMYYLQSRYYNPTVGRFVNADMPEFGVLYSHNLCVYSNNNPIKLIDKTGYLAGVDDITVLALFGLICILIGLVSIPEFKQAWDDFCITVGNKLSWMKTTIVNGGRAIWDWTKSQIKAATEATTALITITKAEVQIRKKVKKNSKPRYWAAAILKIAGYPYATIYSAITYTAAKERVRLGLSVFAVTKHEALILAKNFPPVVGPEKGLKKRGQFWHYHVKGRKSNAHVLFLF